MGMVEKLLGFAIKANKIVFGTDNILKKRVYLIIAADSLSKVAVKKLVSTKKDVPLFITNLSIEQFIRREGCKVIGLADSQMANAIINNFDSNYQRIILEEN